MTPCPSDPGCDLDPRHPAAGCLVCGLGRCAGCGARLDPAELAGVAWVPGDRAPGTLCAGCLADDSDGVPLPVGEQDDSALMVEPRTLSDAELLEIAEHANEPFCACGRVVSRCDRSRAGCSDVRARRAA